MDCKTEKATSNEEGIEAAYIYIYKADIFLLLKIFQVQSTGCQL